MSPRRSVLVLAGVGVAFAALLHVVAIFARPTGFAFLGAPPGIVLSSAEGSGPAIGPTLLIAGVLGIWAPYAFSAAGLVRMLPLRRTVPPVVAAIFLLHGAAVVPMLMHADLSSAFDLFHVAVPAVVLLLGMAYAAGAHAVWRGA